MKNLKLSFMVLCLSVTASALTIKQPTNYGPYPKPDRGYVTDIANLLTDEQEERLESLIYTCEKNNDFEMAVVTINSISDYPGTANESIEAFATGLFNAYGIGNMPQNNGILLLVAVKDSEARIELGAFYKHDYDSAANSIMQNKIIPRFKAGRYDEGVIKGTKALLFWFGHAIIIPWWVNLTAGVAVFFLVPTAISLFLNGKRGWGWICVGIIIVILLALLVAIKKIAENMPATSRHGGWGGGFGGGFSGGGGATGRW